MQNAQAYSIPPTPAHFVLSVTIYSVSGDGMGCDAILYSYFLPFSSLLSFAFKFSVTVTVTITITTACTTSAVSVADADTVSLNPLSLKFYSAQRDLSQKKRESCLYTRISIGWTYIPK